MRRYVLGPEPGAENLRIEEAEEPVLNRHTVVVEMRAWSLNYRDLLVANGQYGGKYQPGVVPFSDGAGEVIAVGDEVAEFKVGDMVASCFFRGWQEGPLTAAKGKSALGAGGNDGVLAERVAMPEWAWVRAPDGLSFAEAATLPCAAVTAWNALFDTSGLQAGQTVLLQGTGGVSMFGLQFAKAAGARAFITSSSDEKLDIAGKHGADLGINYKSEPDWERVAFQKTGEGVDVILEVGGSETLGRSLRALRPGGHIAVIGLLSGAVAEVSIGHLLTKNVHLTGIYVGSRAQFVSMNRAIEQSALRPVIDQTFDFDDVQSAYRRLASGRHVGKVVVTR